MKHSPWGKVSHSEKYDTGIHWVSTPTHGGFMFSKGQGDKLLSKDALECASLYNNYYCFEEDCDYAVVYFELPTLPDAPSREKLLSSLSLWNADYLLARGVTPIEPEYSHYRARKIDRDMRLRKDPDLIVSACSLGDGVTKVYTADDKAHFVTSESYSNKHPLNLLSWCELVENYTQTAYTYF